MQSCKEWAATWRFNVKQDLLKDGEKGVGKADATPLFRDYPDPKLEKLLEGEAEPQAEMARGVYYANYRSRVGTSHLDAAEVVRVMQIVDKARVM